MAEKAGLERDGLVGFLAEIVCVRWTNVLICKFLKVQKTLGILWTTLDNQE
ncbi:hypothetical protein [uncultured Megasphaera sp.]|uniref:hypothetical protein n=1 Tax=uncultured Megasphaera sp. TaxID=165188 RepID=UPI00266BEA47|nr:hypothetical protein [uncultured Megasphaera sp.]